MMAQEDQTSEHHTTKYQSELIRLETFDQLLHCALKPTELAAAGFFLHW